MLLAEDLNFPFLKFLSCCHFFLALNKPFVDGTADMERDPARRNVAFNA